MPRARQALALVVGAGLAGPAVARGLAALGIAVDLIEIRPEDAEPGAGLLLTGNALLALDALGVGGAVREAGRAVSAVRYADAQGGELFELALDAEWPDFVSIHRAALRRLLLDDLRGVALRFGVSLDSIESAEGNTRVRLMTGDSIEYDLVVCADGVHSRGREQVFAAPPLEPIPGYAGFRCVAPSRVELAAPTWFLGNGATLLLHPLRGGDVYCGAGPIDETLLPASGSDLERLRAAFEGFGGPAERFLAELPPETRLAPTRYWEVSHAPWHRGRCVLIGDAAHACAPTLAQGAAMAFEDAVVLCDELAASDRIDAALAAFEARRRPRVAAVQRASRARMDANRVLAPHALAVRDGVLRAVGAARLAAEWEPFVSPKSIARQR